MEDPHNIDFKAELIRKTIHLLSLSIPIVYFFLSKRAALTILIPLTLMSLIVDIARYYHPPTARLFYKLFGWLLRSHEVNEKTKTLNGATYVLISATSCVALFPKLIVITSFAILIISDMAAALVGRLFGKHRLNIRPTSNKSFEGSAAFLVSAVIVVLLTPKILYTPVEYLIGFFAALVGMLAEYFSYDFIDDNLSVPIAVGGTMWTLYALFFPTLNM